MPINFGYHKANTRVTFKMRDFYYKCRESIILILGIHTYCSFDADADAYVNV